MTVRDDVVLVESCLWTDMIPPRIFECAGGGMIEG